MTTQHRSEVRSALSQMLRIKSRLQDIAFIAAQSGYPESQDVERLGVAVDSLDVAADVLGRCFQYHGIKGECR